MPVLVHRNNLVGLRNSDCLFITRRDSTGMSEVSNDEVDYNMMEAPVEETVLVAPEPTVPLEFEGTNLSNILNLVKSADDDTIEIPKEKTTTPYMTKYERARILGTRALQISMNAPVLVDTAGETDPLRIAEKELLEKVIPLIIRRYLPNGEYEDWPVRELIQ
eukprot:NODE_94_length_21525_cov_0.751003.p14 type:complete len:163 gc:universal NODE_94_length_21525_cov_0.751003:11250-10762(-)